MCKHTRAGGAHLPLAFQPSTMFEGESSAATLIGVEGFTAVRFDTKEGSVESELCTLGARGS